MDDEQPTVRRLSAQLLADVDDARATAALERALRDDDASVRAQALDALAATPGRSSAEAFLPLLDDPDPAVAASAAARPSRRDRTQPPPHACCSDSPPTRPRRAIDRAAPLAAAPPDAAAGLATPALDDEDPGVRPPR